jgi:transposase, IS5 family
MSELLLDRADRRRSPATTPGFHAARPPRSKGLRYPADPAKVEEIIAVMRAAGDDPHGRRLRRLGCTVGRRTGDARDEVLGLTGACGRLAAASVRDARALAARLRAAARGRGARAKLAAAKRLERACELAEKVCEQIRQRLVGEPIRDRLVSLADPDARPIRKGKAGKPTEFGSVHQIAEITPHTRKGARGFVLPPATAAGNPGEERLLPATVSELEHLGLTPVEVAVDGGFPVRSTQQALESIAPERLFIAGRRSTTAGASTRTRERLASYRTGSEGRISHLKRDYGLRRSRLRGAEGTKTWVGWAALAHNLDTYAVYAVRRA